ncbi:hypothetical protein [Labrys miyagiensis]|uniref:hypothetical protein n=1 Tax=Labrys miyagiensis TaxID=346912 RepID=UPI0024E12054|nr:hypothetical protein [Labrys miyagiensis]
MADRLKVPATEFSRNFARYRDEAIARKIVYITSRGSVVGAYLSAGELKHYEGLKHYEPEVLVVGNLSEEAVVEIEVAEYGVAPRD